MVARAIFNSEIPVISAVGHETDFTIADFVADLRAPTPSAAAELAVPDMQEIQIKLNNYTNRFKLALRKKVELMRLKYEKCMATRAFKEPLQHINEQYIQLDMLVKNIQHNTSNRVKDNRNRAMQLIAKLDTLSPLKTLTRGYCIAQIDQKVIKSVTDVKKEDIMQLRFTDGEVTAKVVKDSVN